MQKEQRVEEAVFCSLPPLNNYYVWNNNYGRTWGYTKEQSKSKATQKWSQHGGVKRRND